MGQKLKINSYNDLVLAINLLPTRECSEVKALMLEAKKAQKRLKKKLNKIHGWILEVEEDHFKDSTNNDLEVEDEEDDLNTDIDNELGKEPKVSWIETVEAKAITGDILHEIDPLKMDSGYISYLLQKYPDLYGMFEPKSKVVLSFTNIEWYSIIAVCEKHPHLANHVKLLDARFKDRLGNHLKREVLECIVAMKNPEAKNKILTNLISHIQSLAKGCNVKSLIYKRVIDTFTRKNMAFDDPLFIAYKSALFELQK